jgi:secreted trypsin-like serine protease
MKNYGKYFTSGSTACVGESGGGFALKKGSKWYLRGVVSFCNETIPSLYLDLADQMEWIKQKAFTPCSGWDKFTNFFSSSSKC